MATDLKTGIDAGEPSLARPSLKITGLHIRGLKSIGSLDLPEDGLGWDGPIPDFVMVGGINGSGKTTLLEFLAGVFEELERNPTQNKHLIPIHPAIRATEASVDFSFSPGGLATHNIRFLIGNQRFIDANRTDNWLAVERDDQYSDDWAIRCGSFDPELLIVSELASRTNLSTDGSGFPHVICFPSEGRTLISPATDYKFAGKLLSTLRFVDRWVPPEKWTSSLEARLYAIRWEDLNAKEVGGDVEPNGFEAYSQAFDRFFEGRKRLKWTSKGELVVETKNNDIHELSDLSSGEKQVILFMGELLHRWRPGSLILIDEPELHLHESYQTRLWQSLVDWQKERGGQVIVATQSGHLFRISESAMKVLLSRQSR